MQPFANVRDLFALNFTTYAGSCQSENDGISLEIRISIHNQQRHKDRAEQKGFPLLGQQFDSAQSRFEAKQSLPGTGQNSLHL